MKFYERFSSGLRRVSSNKTIIKKLLSRGSATLVLTAGLWMFTESNEKPFSPLAGVGSPATIEQAFESRPQGLSRQRKDFDRAFDILATAASSDERLTGYFTRLQKRVRGETTSPENGSGVRVVNRQKKNAETVEVETLSATEVSLPVADKSLPKNVISMLKDFFVSPMIEDSRTAPNAGSVAEANREPVTGATSLTVGDVTFETNPAIERWINYYTATQRGRQTMQIGIRRSGSYIDLARAEFQRLGVPEDLVWLAHVESVWHTTAMSPAAAGGLWQFIPRTATDYGLTVSQEYDERLDPAKQTQVAAAYLRDLYTIFGDWALAMAAYNCGEPRVMSAIVKNGEANFWELHQKQLLPQETLNYVPKILAAIEVASRAESYGFTSDVKLEEPFTGR